MILVTTGTNGSAFDRLLGQLDGLAPGEEVVVQHGPSALRPRGAKCVTYLPFEELSRLMHEARVVVTHGGAGSVLAALYSGHRPLVVPRRAVHREAIDDHQEYFARRLAAERLVTVVDDPARLPELVGSATRTGDRVSDGGGLRDELGAYLRAAAGAAA